MTCPVCQSVDLHTAKGGRYPGKRLTCGACGCKFLIKALPVPRRCPQCRRLFIPRRSDAVHCGRACRNKAWFVRQETAQTHTPTPTSYIAEHTPKAQADENKSAGQVVQDTAGHVCDSNCLRFVHQSGMTFSYCSKALKMGWKGDEA
jgi:hypothetical protein